VTFLTAVFSAFPIVSLSALLKPNGTIDYSGLIEFIFNSEFSSGSRNLSLILLNGQSYSSTDTILPGILKGLGLEKLMWFVSDNKLQSGNIWFNETYRFFENSSGQSGWGFSLIADGFINFNIYGVILIYLFIGLIIVFFYRLAFRNIWFMSYYIFLAFTIIYSLRADIANLISPLLWHGIFIFYFPYLFFYKNHTKRIN
jgi:hypothetical protein